MIDLLLKCTFDGQPFTVGEKKSLTCDLGHVPTGKPEFTWAPESPTADKNQVFEIQFIGPPVVQGNVLTQTFTSYKVGTHTLNQIKVKNADANEYLVSPVNFEVKSIVSGSPTPFPIVDPERVPIPWWWWAIWVAVLVVLAIIGLWQFLKARRRRALKVAASNVRKLTPREEFQTKIRKLESKGLHNRGEYKAFALELTTIIKKTIGEELAFAAEDLTSEELLTTLERRHKAYFITAGRTLESFLADLDRIKFAKVETDAQACAELLDRGARIGHALFGRST